MGSVNVDTARAGGRVAATERRTTMTTTTKNKECGRWTTVVIVEFFWSAEGFNNLVRTTPELPLGG